MTTGASNRLRIEPQPQFAKILRVEDAYETPGSGASAARINGRFDRLVVQSGTTATPGVVLRFCILGGVTVGGTVFVVTDNLLWTAIGLALGAFLPVYVLLVARARRRRKLDRQIPVLIEGLEHVARNGRGLSQCLEIAAAETPAPLSDEIGRGVRRMRMGIGIEAAFEDLPIRTGSTQIAILVAALAEHDRTGCDLIDLLERLKNRLAACV
jgi:Flp pilus assembly protein TadB